MLIQSLERAINILNLFTLSQTSMGIVEMSERMHLSKSTVHGLVKTLGHYGFLRQDHETRKYSLGFRIYELGATMQSTLQLNRIAADSINSLSQRTKLDVRISIWNENSVLYTLSALGSKSVYFSKTGPRIPAYCTAHGRIFLAYFEAEQLNDYLDTAEFVSYTPFTITSRDELMEEIERTRTRGYAVDSEELYLGKAAMGAPIFQSKEVMVAAISIAGASDVLEKNEKKIAGELLKTATYISRDLGYIPEQI